jgi:formylglycine-generating enzyme required for sulfatase activity
MPYPNPIPEKHRRERKRSLARHRQGLDDMRTRWLHTLALLSTVTTTAIAADSMLRIACDDTAAGAEITINGKFKGECPIDLSLPEGAHKLSATKNVDSTHARTFNVDIRIGDGVVKRVEVMLGEPELTPEGRRLEAERQRQDAELAAERQRLAAERIRQLQERNKQNLAAFKARGNTPGEPLILQDCPECPEMVLIPPGNFMMGSGVGITQEQPVHSVRVDGFALAKTEVTVGQFRRFNHSTGYKTTAEQSGKCWALKAAGDGYEEQPGRYWDNPGFNQGENYPVACVSWDDAKAYVAWLSRETGQSYRLPSEAEWEYAARAGATGKWIWGDDENRNCLHANIADQTLKDRYPNKPGRTTNCLDGQVHTAPVGSFLPNGFGLVDMSGNVWEWTEDCWNAGYSGAPTDGKAWSDGN